jgi:oligopeptide transport system ATP-binding protein
MYEPTAGDILIDGESVAGRLTKARRHQFARQAQMIFQDPYASLNPRMTVGDIIAEGPDIHGLWTRAERRQKVDSWLDRVGLLPEHAFRFPHEFSGGQRQRIGLARALALEPRFVVCDEPISALDVSVQAQVVTLLQDLQRELGLTYLFIAHGLSMVRYISSRMAVMYLGQIVELGPSEEVFFRPLHPYSQALVAANPLADPNRERSRPEQLLKGELPSPINPPPGCRFAARCPHADQECRQVTPSLRQVEKGHDVACHKV